MDLVATSKILSNGTRLKILQWLKNPEEHFPFQHIKGNFDDGVCVQYIGEKSGLSLSTISHYLSMMQRVGLVTQSRFGKYTYYKRNEEAITEFIDFLRDNL